MTTDNTSISHHRHGGSLTFLILVIVVVIAAFDLLAHANHLLRVRLLNTPLSIPMVGRPSTSWRTYELDRLTADNDEAFYLSFSYPPDRLVLKHTDNRVADQVLLWVSCSPCDKGHAPQDDFTVDVQRNGPGSLPLAAGFRRSIAVTYNGIPWTVVSTRDCNEEHTCNEGDGISYRTVVNHYRVVLKFFVSAAPTPFQQQVLSSVHFGNPCSGCARSWP